MTFRFQLVERVREHHAKHAKGVAKIVPPETIALATAIEGEMQRFADHMRDGLKVWQERTSERLKAMERDDA